MIRDAQQECGDIFSIRILGLGDWTFLCSPELLRVFYKTSDDVLAAGEVNRTVLGYMLGTHASFSFDGEDHLRRQRLVLRNLTGQRLLDHSALMQEVAAHEVGSWPSDRPFAFLHRMHFLALEILVRIILGVRERERCRQLVEVFDVFASRGLRSPLLMMPALQLNLGKWSPWGRILGMKRRLMEEFSREVRGYLDRADLDQSEDFLACLIRAGHEAGTPLSEEDLLHESINLIFAGHETTSLALTWVTERLIARPDVLRQAREEIEGVVGDRPIEAEHVKELEYLAAVIHETFRWRPFAPMASLRLVKKPFEIGGYVVPEGGIVTQAFSAIAGRNETFPDPERFDPDRFYRKAPPPHYAWKPFGGGRHTCTGKSLAEHELPIVLATIIQKADLSLAQDDVRAVRAGFFFGPNQGLRVVARARDPRS